MVPSGNLFVVAAPSGTGKTTLVKAVVDRVPGIVVSISHTTRPKRPAEINGEHYYFIDQNQFRSMVENNAFLEHATVFGHGYGTSRSWVEQTLIHGTDVILEIDWQGCQQIQALFPDCVSIFILPPSLSELETRLKTRNQDRPEIIIQRLSDARETLSHLPEYDYIVVNANFEIAVDNLIHIVRASRLRRKNQMLAYAKLLSNL